MVKCLHYGMSDLLLPVRQQELASIGQMVLSVSIGITLCLGTTGIGDKRKLPVGGPLK